MTGRTQDSRSMQQPPQQFLQLKKLENKQEIRVESLKGNSGNSDTFDLMPFESLMDEGRWVPFHYDIDRESGSK